MIKLDIEIYGVPSSITKIHRAEIELGDNPDIVELLSAMVQKIPALSGNVIDRDKNALMAGFVLNIDGQYCSGTNKKLAGEEHIVLLALASGG
jgi:hypothetical protein